MQWTGSVTEGVLNMNRAYNFISILVYFEAEGSRNIIRYCGRTRYTDGSMFRRWRLTVIAHC